MSTATTSCGSAPTRDISAVSTAPPAASQATVRLARTDALTGAANGRCFYEATAAEAGRAARDARPLTLAYLDLDDFKQVNDHYGHTVGDDVLVTLSERLRDSVRSADPVARLGGEEFALLLPETDLPGALAVAERARSAFSGGGVQLRSGIFLTVTASFGVADFPVSPDRAALLRDADQALYAAKRLGKDRVVPVTRAVTQRDEGQRYELHDSAS